MDMEKNNECKDKQNIRFRSFYGNQYLRIQKNESSFANRTNLHNHMTTAGVSRYHIGISNLRFDFK
ncbi:hypothetical protein YC2023_105139 [Brassica napus]